MQAGFFHRAVCIAKAHKAACDAKGLKKVAEFRASMADGDASTWPAGMKALKDDVTAFSRSFPVVGFDGAAMRYSVKA